MADPLDAILQEEAAAADRGAAEGFLNGIRDGYAEGFTFGVQKGYALGRDMGRMMGVIQLLKTRVPRSALSSRIIGHMEKIEEEIAQLPMCDATDDSLVTSYNGLRQRFRALLASIGSMRLFEEAAAGDTGGSTAF
jgi:hypothetical protein